MPAPVLVLRNHQLRGQLFNVSQPDLRPRLPGTLCNSLGEPMNVACGAVVDDGNPRFHRTSSFQGDCMFARGKQPVLARTFVVRPAAYPRPRRRNDWDLNTLNG